MSPHIKHLFYSAGLMAATTVGAGMFALPYVFQASGWIPGILYLAVLGFFVAFAHELYAETLEKVRERKLLVGFAEMYFGVLGRWFGFVIVVGGLILTLVAYLVLVGNFTELLFPGFGVWGIAVFWFLASLPIVLRLSRLVASEIVGGLLMLAVIGIIFAGIIGDGDFSRVPLARGANFFLPFSVVLFALAGWSGVDPILEYGKKTRLSGVSSRTAMAWGTAVAVVLYVMFVVGVLGSTPTVTEDTLGGLASVWPAWKFVSLIVLGLFAIWTSYIPIGLEIRNALHRDLKWPSMVSAAAVFAVPPLLIVLGLKSFFTVVGLVGGVFLSLQYFLIILVARKALMLTPVRRLLAYAVAAIFLGAALYEIAVLSSI